MSKHDHDRGLNHDVQQISALAKRREFLQWLSVLAIAPMFNCADSSGDGTSDNSGGGDAGVGGGSSDASTSATGSSDAGTDDAGSANTVTECSKIPEETAGPYPGDGSNGPNALSLSGIVRSDIRSSFAGASGTAAGVLLTIKLSVVSTTDGCAARSGYAVYLWHCNREGLYSLYSAGVTDQNYLRGVQETDDAGTVTFTSIFPACYSGRWPHIHFEIYPSLASANAASNKLATSQIAMPEGTCNTVFATDGYSASVNNLKQTSLTTDMVFSDGVTLQTPTVTGNVSDGYVISLVVGIAD